MDSRIRGNDKTMNTKILTPRAISVIDQYLHFKVGNATCPIPYFNNKTVGARATLAVFVGKGSPKEIFEETEALMLKNHVAINSISNESLKKFLTDLNIGIDCSAFAYYILNAQSVELNKGSLDKHMSFVQSKGFFGRIISSMNPVRNTGVITFAHNKNSKVIQIKEMVPGDMITMLGIPNSNPAEITESQTGTSVRDHILVIHQVEYQNFIPYKLHYSHAIAYPEDGVYGSGVKQGTIEILDLNKPITEQRWIENEKQGEQNRLFTRACKSNTEIRRLKWM